MDVRTKLHKYIAPDCCEDAQKAVFLEFDMEATEDRAGQDAYTPRWRVVGMHPDWPGFHAMSHEVKFCPFCGTSMPQIRKRKRPIKKTCRIVDTGYHCDTCKERLMGCKCLPPEFAWETVK